MENKSCIKKHQVKEFCKREKFVFLERCMKWGILLPSNNKGKVDFDLLLINQERRLRPQVKLMLQEYTSFKDRVWPTLSQTEKTMLIQKRNEEKERLKRKFYWLRKKQTKRRKNAPKTKYYGINDKKIIKNRKDRKRYKKRKRWKENTIIINEAKNIVNKSNIKLDINDLKLLSLGLNFVPTPNWNNAIERKEWTNWFYHVRRVEWHDYFKDSESSEQNIKKNCSKLNVPNHSRPQKECLSEEAKTYVELSTNKLRTIVPTVKNQYKRNNNLSKDLKESLQKLKKAVENKEIVFCKSDKDGKTLVLNYTDYMEIIRKELNNYKLLDLTKETSNNKIKKIKTKAEQFVVELYKCDVIDEDLLYRSVGINAQDNGETRRTSGTKAKYFSNMDAGYVYPLLKTHKLKPEEVDQCNVQDIPVRLVQSAGHTFLSRITAMINVVLNPISVAYCKTVTNEYCKDSASYMEHLMAWKDGDKHLTKKCFIVAADVKSLYPSLNRDLIKTALEDALVVCSSYSEAGRTIITKLVLHCLNNVLLEFDGNFYVQERGIVTGENYSVPLANITLHYVVKNIPEINLFCRVFKRYIDDVIFITDNRTDGETTKKSMIENFGLYSLELTFGQIDTRNNCGNIEFLDTLHSIDDKSSWGFRMKNFIKPTATNSLFLNGKSHHPLSVFKGIVFGESKRLRRLNEWDVDYHISLEGLKEKCIRSGFNKRLVR